jgi:ABC-2 type transport system ATP-binding protein
VLVIVSGRLAIRGLRDQALMTDRPLLHGEPNDNRKFAQALVGDPTVLAVEFAGERLTVRTSQFAGFIHAAPRIARAESITIRELLPTDESLESVFSYLVSK